MNDVASEWAEAIESKRATFMAFVKQLKEQLTNEAVDVRAEAFQLFAKVLMTLPLSSLDPMEIEETIRYCTSIVVLERGNAENLIAALHYLVVKSGVSLEVLREAIGKLLKKRIAISLRQAERCRIYTIIVEYVKRCAERNEDGQLINEFLLSAHGEADPRCLLVIFEICSTMAKKFDVGLQSEELYEFLDEYFPIMFKPPPNDPFGITREILEAALIDALTAADWLAKYVFGNLTKQFVYATGNLEIMCCTKLLKKSLEAFSPILVIPNGCKVWKLLSKQLLTAEPDSPIAKQAFEVYDSLCRLMLSTESQATQEQREDFLQFMTDDVQVFFSNPELNMLNAAYRVLFAASEQSAESFAYIFRWAAVRIFEGFQMTETHRSDYAEFLLFWCGQVRKWGCAAVDPPELVQNVKTFVMENLLTSDETRLSDIGVATIACLAPLCPDLVGEADARLVSRKLMELSASNSLAHGKESLGWFGFVAEVFWPMFRDSIYPNLVEEFGPSLVNFGAVPYTIAGGNRAMDFALRVLTDGLTAAQTESDVRSACQAFLLALKTLEPYERQSICRIIYALLPLIREKVSVTPIEMEDSIVAVGDICGKLMQDVYLLAPSDLSESMLKELLNVALNFPDAFFHSPFCLYVVIPIVCAAQWEHLVKYKSLILHLWAIEPCRAKPADCKEWCRCSVLFSCLLYNSKDDEFRDQIISGWAERCEELFAVCGRCFVNTGYLVKTLLMKNNPTGLKLVENYLKLLQQENGEVIMSTLRLAYSPASKSDKNEFYRTISPFYRERVSEQSFPLFRNTIDDARKSRDPDYLSRACEAFAVLWSFVPGHLLCTLPKLLDPMLLALKTDRPSVTQMAIDLLHSFLQSKLVLSKKLSDIVDICTALIDCCSKNIDIATCCHAFQCLQHLAAEYGQDVDKNVRRSLISAMRPFLAHRKRLVRQSAAEAINAWSLH